MNYATNNRSFLQYSGILGVLLFIAATYIGGMQAGYHQNSQYISESYAKGMEYGPLLRYLGFIPSGLLIAFFYLRSGLRKSSSSLNSSVRYGLIGVGVFYGLFTALAGVFICDEDCARYADTQSVSQLIHNFLGGITYLLTPFSILLTGIGLLKEKSNIPFARYTVVSGLLSIALVVFFFLNLDSPMTGIYQRLAEASFLMWIVLCSVGFRKILISN
ncbi:DUF998 domain-containing protein [Leptobacterium flavescens]|uniref:DUF998 domain-containing protein n=1 Tax=Leptobacterium flavescens TaxID=472055 RepID=A0A6P0UJ59_9FLAO|nr:DUF998 domain-containing protein [Leptobacterium flavescens]NER11879.1 DUF998 domain-containing protein [Leptobacterium flavescens]